MTVSSELNRKEYTGDGSTTAFSTSPVVFFDAADLKVYEVVTATGVATLKTITTHYTVSGGSGSTGTVTMVTAPTAAQTLVIVRDLAITQSSDLVNNDGSDAEVLEDALDRLTMVAQQHDARLDRTLRQPDSDTADLNEIPTSVDRASKYLGFNSSGQPVALDAPTSTSITTAFSQTLLDDANAVQARTTLGAMQDDTKTTVASGTAPDIWTSTGNIIDYTGTATATSFAAAPQAGARRTLICADACVFTTSANLIVEGFDAGRDVTMAANAIVEVLAITTTQFKLRYSITGSFTATGTGFASNPTGTVRYTVTNGVASLSFPQLTGTSNATTFTITGLPACVAARNQHYAPVPLVADNGTTGPGLALTDGTTLTLHRAGSTLTWTNLGTKTLYSPTITYALSF